MPCQHCECLTDNQAQLKDGCRLIYLQPRLMTTIPVAIRQWQTKRFCCLTVTALRQWRSVCPKSNAADRGGTRLSDAYRHFTKNVKQMNKKNKPTDAASERTLCHSNAHRRFLIFPPASGGDGCYKNGGSVSRVIEQRRHRKVTISRPDENSLALDGGKDKRRQSKTIVCKGF